MIWRGGIGVVSDGGGMILLARELGGSQSLDSIC